MDSAPSVAMVILAGGVGSRMGADRNKVYLSVRGREILAYSLDTAAACAAVHTIVLVVRDEDRAHAEEMLSRVAPQLSARVVTGGDTRHDSEAAGVLALADEIGSGRVGFVAVHDGARPFASGRLVDVLIAASADGAGGRGGAIPGLAVDDTVFRPGDGVFVPTSDLVRIQTPQVFSAEVVLDAHRRAAAAGFEGVDTAQVVERFRPEIAVVVVAGENGNIKVTYATDMAVAEAIADAADGADDAVGAEPAGFARPRLLWSVTSDRALVRLDPAPAAGIRIAASELRSMLAALPPDVGTIVFADGDGDPGVVLDDSDAIFGVGPMTDAVKVTCDDRVVETVDRATLATVRLPEVVDRAALAAAIATLPADIAVDPSEAIAATGGAVRELSRRRTDGPVDRSRRGATPRR